MRAKALPSCPGQRRMSSLGLSLLMTVLFLGCIVLPGYPVVGERSADGNLVRNRKGRAMSESMQYFSRFLHEVVYPKGKNESSTLKLGAILSNTIHSPVISASRAEGAVKHKIKECSSAGYNILTTKRLTKDDRVRVYIAKDSITNQSFILKVYKSAEDYSDELSFLARADHPSIAKPRCNFRDSGNYPAIVMDLMPAIASSTYFRSLHRPKANEPLETGNSNDKKSSYVGHLPTAISIQHNQAFEQDVVEIASKLYEAIRYMHWLGYSHSDLHAGHILVDDKRNVYIIDFEESVPFPLQNYHRSEPGVNGPEMFLGSDLFQENIDMWSFCSLVATWTVIRYTGDPKWVPVRVSNSKVLFAASLPEYFSENLRQLLYYCFQPDPYSRQFNTRAQQDLFESLPYWRGVDWRKLRKSAQRTPFSKQSQDDIRWS
jgi:hypothetical protein